MPLTMLNVPGTVKLPLGQRVHLQVLVSDHFKEVSITVGKQVKVYKSTNEPDSLRNSKIERSHNLRTRPALVESI
jgi:hypothetical protein